MMYVFREFNQAYGQEVRASLILYLGMLAVAWTSSLYLLPEPPTALAVTGIALVCAHVLRLRKIGSRRELSLSSAQLLATPVFAIVAAILVSFAIWYAITNKQDLSWGT
jgi:hypothetical protein